MGRHTSAVSPARLRHFQRKVDGMTTVNTIPVGLENMIDMNFRIRRRHFKDLPLHS